MACEKLLNFNTPKSICEALRLNRRRALPVSSSARQLVTAHTVHSTLAAEVVPSVFVSTRSCRVLAVPTFCHESLGYSWRYCPIPGRSFLFLLVLAPYHAAARAPKPQIAWRSEKPRCSTWNSANWQANGKQGRSFGLATAPSSEHIRWRNRRCLMR